MNPVTQDAKFYLHHDNQQIGPFTIPAIQEMVKAGTVTLATHAWREGLPDWIPLKDLAEYQQQTMVIPATLPNIKASNNAPSIAGTPADWNRPQEEGNYGLAIAGGLAGAVLGAIVWAGIVVGAHIAIGFIAIGVGWLAGNGTVLLSKKKGQTAQIIAAACGFFGLFLGKYLIVCSFIATELGGSWMGAVFNPGSINIFFRTFGDFFSLFDILWYIFAISAAWRVPAE